MAGLKDVTREFKLMLDSAVEEECDKIEAALTKECEAIIDSAIRFREQAPDAHDITGNLLNSIVVALYRRGRLVSAFLSADKVENPIVWKMTQNRKYIFDPDYRGGTSFYKGVKKTDEGYGRNDAESFLAYYKAQKKNIFQIVLAYSTEYAEWLEEKRQTTGFLQTVEFIKISTESAISNA